MFDEEIISEISVYNIMRMLNSVIQKINQCQCQNVFVAVILLPQSLKIMLCIRPLVKSVY